MGQKSSLSQLIQSVSQVLMPDTKASDEGTRGGWVSSVRSMGIFLGGVLGRVCSGRGNWRRTDDEAKATV